MLHPLDCPSQIPNPFTSSVCLLIAQSHCPKHFVLHDSRRDRLPRFPCLLPTPCERGTHLLLADCLESWIAESVKDVFHVAGLPYRCMTTSQLTRFQPNLLPWCCLTFLSFQFNYQRTTALERMHHEQIRETSITLNVCHPTPSTVLCRQIMMHQPAIAFSDADNHVLEVGFADLCVNLHYSDAIYVLSARCLIAQRMYCLASCCSWSTMAS